MKLTQRLLSYLHRAFRRDPKPMLALRLRYDGEATSWRVHDAQLTTSVEGGTGEALDIDLTAYTLNELADYLADQPGYSVLYQPPVDLGELGARTLLDGTGDPAESNGDHLYAYTAIEYAYLEAVAPELKHAREQIGEMLAQMTTQTAQHEWLDELGEYYDVRRLDGESDERYGPRIIYEVVRPRNNNKAIEIAIREATDDETTRVIDVVEQLSAFPTYRGDQAVHDSTYNHTYTGTYRRNLFDVQRSFPIAEGDETPDAFVEEIKGLIDDFRSAGMHLRRVLLQGVIFDDYPTGDIEEEISAVAVYVPVIEDLFGSAIGDPVLYNDSFFYNDEIDYSGRSFYDGRQIEQNPNPVSDELDYALEAGVSEMFGMAEESSLRYDGIGFYNGNYRYGPTTGNDVLDLFITYHN